MSALTFYGAPEKMTRRLAATVIGSQGLAVFFGALVARGLASARGDAGSGSFLLVGSVLAVLCILDAGLLRRPWGITLGWLLQLATLLSALVVPMMLVVGLFFLALWVTCLVKGASIDAEMARRERQASDGPEAGEGAADPADRVDG